MSTELRNLSSSELHELAAWWKTGTLAECARRVLAEREAASTRLSEICKEVKAENTCQRN